MIGRKIIHARYGEGKVTHIWRKLINPETGQTKLDGLTFELSTEKGKMLHNKDRTFRNMGHTKPLPRCYENDLTKIKLDESSKKN